MTTTTAEVSRPAVPEADSREIDSEGLFNVFFGIYENVKTKLCLTDDERIRVKKLTITLHKDSGYSEDEEPAMAMDVSFQSDSYFVDNFRVGDEPVEGSLNIYNDSQNSSVIDSLGQGIDLTNQLLAYFNKDRFGATAEVKVVFNEPNTEEATIVDLSAIDLNRAPERSR